MHFDVNPDLGGVVIRFLEVQERRNLLQFLLHGPRRHGTACPLFGMGDIHSCGIGSQRGTFAGEMIDFRLQVGVPCQINKLLLFDGDLILVGLN